jgi:cellobiose phosphorylase
MDPRDSRITRWRYNGLPWDRPGRYVYIREMDGDYWSLSWQPTPKEKLDFYECRHGMGYTTISTKRKGLRGEITYFVPQDDDLEIWLVSLSNETYEERRISIFPYVELCLGHALVDLINQPNDQHFNVVNFDKEDGTLYATKNYWVTNRKVSVEQPNQGWDKKVFFTTSLPIIGWDGSKDEFIGRWRSESDPIAVENGKLGDTNITAGDACAALQSEIVIGPGERVEFVVLMGVTDAECNAQEIIAKYRSPDVARRELDRVKAWWDEYLSSVQVETPDREMNLMLNVWGKRQAWVTFNMNRNAGYYHGGLLFGVGIRDQSQDLMGPILSQPEDVADRIAEVISHQFRDGSTLHNYFKLTGQGEKTGHSDTPLWLPLGVMSYVKETGDYSFLERSVPFQDGGEPSTVLDHIIRAVAYALSNLTPNHLPKFGPGDWNDTLDYVGRKGIGESVWVAEFLCYILKETSDLLERVGRPGKAAELKSDYRVVSRALNERCWDGEWYIRGTRDDGGVIGSHKNEEGRIFMNAQSWAVISAIAPPERPVACMESAYRMMDTPRGPKMLHPAYTKVDPGIGLATRCVPGKKENGAIFNHPASWAILAECILGNGDRAYEWYRKCMPMIQAHDPDIYKMEPYVYSEYVTSPDHPTFGQASHSWLTGSGVWMFRDGLDWILGVRPTYNGLMVDPCIPQAWDGYKVTRKFRGATYEIEVKNPDHVQTGVESIEMDGVSVDGNVLPIVTAGTTAKVVVTMG